MRCGWEVSRVKRPLADFAHEHFVPELKIVKRRRGLAVGHQLEEEFQLPFVRRRHDRVGPLQLASVFFHSKRGVLPRRERKFRCRINADHPEVGREIRALGNTGPVVFVIHGSVLGSQFPVLRKCGDLRSCPDIWFLHLDSRRKICTEIELVSILEQIIGHTGSLSLGNLDRRSPNRLQQFLQLRRVREPNPTPVSLRTEN